MNDFIINESNAVAMPNASVNFIGGKISNNLQMM